MRCCRSQKPAKSTASVIPIAAGCHPAQAQTQRRQASAVPSSFKPLSFQLCADAAAERLAVDLTGAADGQLLAEMDHVRPLVFFHPLADPRAQLAFLELSRR